MQPELGVGMLEYDIILNFTSDDEAFTALAVGNLAAYLKHANIRSSVIPNPQSQDLGTAIGVILGSAAIIELARGIADYVRRFHVSDIEVVGKTKVVRIKNVSQKSLPELVEKISLAID